MRLSKRTTYGIATGLLIGMAVLMFGAAQHDSATVDETTALSTGYTYWQGHRFFFVPEHPPLGQMLPAIPLLFMDVKMSDTAQALLAGRLSYPWTRPWAGSILSMQGFIPAGCGGKYVDLHQPPFHRLVGWDCPTTYPLQNWYLWALPESQIFGQMLIFDGTNDGSAMLLAGRCVQILLTLGVGLLIGVWIRRVTANDWAALVGLAFWAFNPNVLAHGHLTTTDMGAAFGVTLAIFAFALLLEAPTPKTGVVCGGAVGLALLMKLTTVILAPVFVLLLIMHWRQLKPSPRSLWKAIGIAMLAGWVVVMLAYFPHWLPAPAISEAQARDLGVPDWFTVLRPLLIPADLFKALGLTLGHSAEGHEAYFLGEWSQKGWLGYYPVTFFLKSPIAFVVATGLGASLLWRQWKTVSLLERAAWIGAGIFFVMAMTSHVNIGIRHILPVLPLLCVGLGCAAARVNARPARIAVGVLIVWQAVVAVAAYPFYLQFFSEAVGGAKNGYRYLLDSNYDWGQDANRLKAFLDTRGIRHIYLDYFGTQYNIEYLKISNTRVSAEQAKQIKQGWLVVSASQLMRPEWAWLRESCQPAARVAATLFVYQFP